MKKRIFCILTSIIMLWVSIPAFSQEYTDTYRDYFPFEDIEEGEWYTPAVEFCYVNTYMRGISNTKFDHSSQTTREQIIMILANISGEDISEYENTTFTDIQKGEWYSNAIAWAQENEYTNGIGNQKFGLGNNITREEAVTVFYNFIKRNTKELTESKELDSFTDADTVSDWALDAMKWAVGSAVIKGNDKNQINPLGLLTRAQAAQLIMNVELNCIYNYHEHEFETTSCTEPAKCISKENTEGECPLLIAPAKGHRTKTSSLCLEFTSCIDCGAELFSPMGHNFLPASCTEPMTCERCGTTEGEPLGHTAEKDMCLRCGKEYFSSSYDKLVYYLENKGAANDTEKYFYATVNYNNADHADQYIKYKNNAVYFENTYYFPSSNHKLFISLKLDNTSGNQSYTVDYIKNNSTVYSGSGIININTYTKSMPLTFTSYSGDQNSKAELEALASVSMTLNLDATAYLLEKEVGMKLSELGFSNF
ncbi:MAG: S-layer homology domain-containing protein [Clostridia bacterium]|nr:S-layer homology domain-containing protein [Clostridia bacterium]